MRTRREVHHVTITAILFVFLLLLLWPDDAAVDRHGGNRSEAPDNTCLSPKAKTGRYPSGFV